jgi:hypothetical protein
VDFPAIPAFRGFPGEAMDHSDLITRADPMVTATADGTFYIGWDAIAPIGPLNVKAGGIAVSKSTDGGRTWSTPVLTGTGVDRPWMTADLSTGTVYEASAGPIDSNISTGNPALPPFGNGISDRWVVSSSDGVNWTSPHGLGGGGFSGANGATISAANGELAAGLRATNPAACSFFIGLPMPVCTVFETSTDSGATWSRHLVPAPATSIGSVEVAADPAQPGTSTVVVSDATGGTFLPFVTHDNGTTWSAGAPFSDDPATFKFKPWISYSPDGTVGFAWRSHTVPGTAQTLPYLIFAATSNDEGATWSAPLQISTAPSPGYDPHYTDGGEDDTSAITLNKQEAFIGWGDWRPGDVQGFFSAVKLQAFDHHS